MTHEAPTKINEGKLYAYSALCTFAATFFLFPIFAVVVPLSLSEPRAVALEGVKDLVFLMWVFGGIPLIVTMFIPSMAVGALSFYASRKPIAAIVGRKIGAVVSTMISAYVAVLFSLHLDIDLYPPAITWSFGPGAYWFPQTLGIFAAVISAPISALFFGKDNIDA